MRCQSRARFTIFAIFTSAATTLLLASTALGGDCNGNGIDDCADIAAGMADTNHNGLPDSCEHASGDYNLNGVVDGVDLSHVLAHWNDAGFGGGALTSVLAHWGALAPPPGPCGPIVPSWATLIEAAPSASVVPNASFRAAITATGWAWRVRDNASNIEMVLIPPGTFPMGCSQGSNQNPCYGWEGPVHQVTLTQAFYMGRTEVTQAQWLAEIGTNPSYFTAANGFPGSTSRPVEQVSWIRIQEFLSQNSLRLPTEAEWEYACRAGTTTPFYNGSTDDNTLTSLAWCLANNSPEGTKSVATKLPNGFGLYDTLGNVWEWVSDWYASYQAGAATNPQGPATGSDRIFRGGYWNAFSSSCRASYRVNAAPDNVNNATGFRVARNP